MSYNFKSLGEVELLNTMPETANVFVEVDGGIRRAPQVQPVDEIAQIVGSETLEEVPEGATVLAEVNGEIKRVPSDGLGGGGTEPLFVYASSDGTALADKSGNNYDLTTILDAYTQGALFYITSGGTVMCPMQITGFNISGNVSFMYGDGKTLLSVNNSAYSQSNFLNYYTEKYGGL